MDWVGHHVDIAHWGLGLDYTGPVEIEGEGKFPKDGLWNAPTEYHYVCKYTNGIEMIVSSEFGGGTTWHGDEGWIHVNRGEINAKHKKVLDEVIGPNEIRLYESRDHTGNFLDCVKSRRQTITPCEVAHRSASVGHLGNIAMLTGRKIRFNPDTEEIIDDSAATRLLGNAMRSPWYL